MSSDGKDPLQSVPTEGDAGTAEADYPGEFSMSREDDTTLIRLGEERYEIVDAVLLGG